MAYYHHNNKDNDNNSSISDDDSDNNGKSPRYAPLFGRYHFHRTIPLLRNLWRYRRYRLMSARRGGHENRWKDRYVRDYPLRYYRTKASMGVLRGLVCVLAWCGSEKHRRARARDQRRRRKDKMEGLSSSSSSSSDSGHSSSGGGESGDGGGPFGGGVERKDFGLGGRKRGGMGLNMNLMSSKRKVANKRKKSLDSGYWKQGSGLVGNGSMEDDLADMERWSNQTRSRASFDFQVTRDDEVGGADEGEIPAAGKARKLKRLGWLRMRRKGMAKGVVDEEKEIGVPEGVKEKGL
ncbi:hypothetical protein N657DRAFT_90141 [Parathielavia appendiculata]|uniref:Uncharacterized protein n=1 Tax=Parathielavia appendiculata TaxID=2587402 RepID=A0AAN6Z955_9PEZI|nr:hypothetical protein N657DRAFT_90141 [Parathielavia appendiculata]